MDVRPDRRVGWATTATGVSHCGAGCTLGDIIAFVTAWPVNTWLIRKGIKEAM